MIIDELPFTHDLGVAFKQLVYGWLLTWTKDRLSQDYAQRSNWNAVASDVEDTLCRLSGTRGINRGIILLWIESGIPGLTPRDLEAAALYQLLQDALGWRHRLENENPHAVRPKE